VNNSRGGRLGSTAVRGRESAGGVGGRAERLKSKTDWDKSLTHVRGGSTRLGKRSAHCLLTDIEKLARVCKGGRETNGGGE